MKKRGFGKGLWNGSGGKPKENETLISAAKREVEEELNVNIQKMEKFAEIQFVLTAENKYTSMHTYLVTKWKGVPLETEEMKPKWFTIDKIPYQKMWKSDQLWLPIVLTGTKIKAKYSYKNEGGNLTSQEIIKTKSFD